jgi:hypothetical protein
VTAQAQKGALWTDLHPARPQGVDNSWG